MNDPQTTRRGAVWVECPECDGCGGSTDYWVEYDECSLCRDRKKVGQKRAAAWIAERVRIDQAIEAEMEAEAAKGRNVITLGGSWDHSYGHHRYPAGDEREGPGRDMSDPWPPLIQFLEEARYAR